MGKVVGNLQGLVVNQAGNFFVDNEPGYQCAEHRQQQYARCDQGNNLPVKIQPYSF